MITTDPTKKTKQMTQFSFYVDSLADTKKLESIAEVIDVMDLEETRELVKEIKKKHKMSA